MALRLSFLDAQNRREAKWKMRKLKQILAVILMTSVIGIGAFGQKKDDDKRPPKDANPVKVRDKDKPPPSNNRGGKDDGKKKPDH